MTLYRWSQTASSDATADPTINWSEGQVPSSINDSARAMMAAISKYRDDIAGAIVTTGTATAYSVGSSQQFDTLAHLNGQMIAFTPHVTNGATCTLSVDSLGAKPLRSAPNAELQSGVLVQGTPYVALYNNIDGAFYVQGNAGSIYGIPLGAGIDFWLSTAPSSAFAFPFGQAISRTTYSSLFAAVGTTYGSGDGSTTFNLPDKRGRVSACPDNMGGTDAARLAGNTVLTNRLSVGGSGGEPAHTLSLSELPGGITSAVSVSGTLTGQTNSFNTSSSNTATPGGGFAAGGPVGTIAPGVTVSGTLNGGGTSNNTGGATHNNMQPTILCNYIMRIV